MIKQLSKKFGLIVAVASAAIVGGATTAVVLAVIPDSGGTIHGCYRNTAGLFDPKGALRVIDSDLSQACTAQETAVNWSNRSSGGGAPKGYAHLQVSSSSGLLTIFSARSNNIVMSNSAFPNCLTLTNGTPVNIAGGGNLAHVAIKDKNGWSDTADVNAEASVTCDQNVPGANIYIVPDGYSGHSVFITVF